MQRNQELDSLRAFAIVFVLISHWTIYWSIANYSFGAIGVDIFFCLSGFLMTLILLKARTHLHEIGSLKTIGNFYIRRILRIFPVYYSALLIVYFVATGTGLAEHFRSYLLFTSNFYFFALGHWDSILSHYWSLAVEIQFYLVWPFVLLFSPKRILRSIFFLGIFIGLAYRIYYFYFAGLTPEHIDFLGVLPQTCLDLFCFGALTASYYLEEGGVFGKYKFLNFLLPVSAVVLFIIVRHYDLPTIVYYRSIIGIMMIYVLSFCLRNSQTFIGKFLRLRPLVYFGQISYGVYIYHNLVEYIVLKYLTPGPLAIFAMFCLILAITSASWFLLESPINRFKLKLTN